MGLCMVVKIHPMNGTSQFLVLNNTLRTVPKRNHLYSVTSNGYTGSQLIHITVAKFLCYIPSHPCIEYACSVNTQQYTQPCLLRRMIHMSKRINPALLIIIYLVQNTIDHSRRSGRAGYFSR